MKPFPSYSKAIALTLALTASPALSEPLSGKVRDYKVEVLASYPHDSEAYTQGLFFSGDSLYETTGQYGRSSIRKVDLKSGKVLRKANLSRRYFGEGSCIIDGTLYMLTWTSKVAFLYDAATFTHRRSVSYPREGWGLAATDAGWTKRMPGAVMVASDGSSVLFFLDADLRTVGTRKVTFGGRPLSRLNELEWIDGRIWANVYLTDIIVIINPETGEVEGKVDCSPLRRQMKETPSMDVLNGIALAPDGSVYLTGKNWPRIFKVKLAPAAE